MTNKLLLYKGALAHLRERTIASLSENREPKRVLDDVYDEVVAYCLERKFWNFSYRSIQLDADANVTPAFGPLYAFTIPTDWIRTRKISANPNFDPPLEQVLEEAGRWYTNITPIYVQYNSNDVQYGMNLGKWPTSFVEYVELRLAVKAAGRITNKDELLQGPQGLLKMEERAYKIANANCAMNEAVGFKPLGSWVRSRRLPGPYVDNPSGPALIP